MMPEVKSSLNMNCFMCSEIVFYNAMFLKISILNDGINVTICTISD